MGFVIRQQQQQPPTNTTKAVCLDGSFVDRSEDSSSQINRIRSLAAADDGETNNKPFRRIQRGHVGHRDSAQS